MLLFEPRSLEPDYLKVFRLATSIFLFLLSIGPAILVVAVADVPWYFGLLVFLLVFLLLYGLFYWYSIHWYKAYSYALTEEGLAIAKGVFWQSKAMIPRNRVQHLDITTGPLERRYDLSKLVIHTAGTHNASVTLPGLLHPTAVELRQSLINQDQQEDTV